MFKKHSVTKNCSKLPLFEWIVLVISKFLQILGLQPRISNFFFWSLEQFFPTVGQNNFGNKIPFLFLNNSNWEKNRGENWENRMICFLVNELWWNYENLFLPLITALFLKQMVKVHFWSVVKFLLWLIKIFRLLYSVW